jgi:hypothetical protein
MTFIAFSVLLIAASYAFIGSAMAVWLLAAAQLLLLAREIIKGQVSGAGGFMFMSFLFFAIRPIYIVLENDYSLLSNLFRVDVSLNLLTNSMWWASLASLAFAIGCYVSPNLYKFFGVNSKYKRAVVPHVSLSLRQGNGLIILQLFTLGIMIFLAAAGRALYGSALGAYVYDLPIPLQAFNIISAVSLFDRYRQRRSTSDLNRFALSALIFLYFTWLMRQVSIFRGFYVFGAMIGIIAILLRIKPKVGYAWLLIPILVFQPFFQTLGETRDLDNSSIREQNILEITFGGQDWKSAYWEFYNSSGDINIFDTFVAAQLSKPQVYPYLMSWIYPPFHIIPRGIWKEKPEKGILQDMSFTNGAPYSPGIAGFFLLDGGVIWMLLSMFALGIVLAILDSYSVLMLSGTFQSCVIAILVVNGMFLTRTFLWFYFWQVIYSVYPIYFISQRIIKLSHHAKSPRATKNPARQV